MTTSLAVVLLGLAAGSCSGRNTGESGPVAPFHAVDARALPFPSNLYTTADEGAVTGLRVDYARHVGTGDALWTTYADLPPQLEPLDGFGTSAGIMIGFDAPVRGDELPGIEGDVLSMASASVRADSAVGLVDAETFERIEFTWRYARDLPTLIVSPTKALRPGHRYAYYVSDRLRNHRGERVRADPVFLDVVEGKDSPWPDEYEGELRWAVRTLAKSVAPAKLVLVDVFTTQSIADETLALRDTLTETYDQRFDSVTIHDGDGVSLPHIRAVYEAAWHEWDYRDQDGMLHSDAAGPLARANLRFFITVPNVGMAPYPIVLVQHGLNNSRHALFGVADQLAQRGFATVAVDAPDHGDRRVLSGEVPGDLGALKEILGLWVEADKFKLEIHRIRDLFRQAVLDHHQIMLAVGRTPDLDFDDDGVQDLDPENWFYYGQSMGAIIGGQTFAQLPDIRAAVLNVGGGRITHFALDHPGARAAEPALAAKFGSVGDAWRLVELMQAALERGDPINYVGSLTSETLPGASPRSLLMQVAYRDGTVPNVLSWDMAHQARLPLLLPSPAIPALQRESRLDLTTAGVAGNVADGLTAALMVFSQITTRSGAVLTADHGNVFGSLEGAGQAACFFRSQWIGGVARVLPPGTDCP